jgi:hypothetical protein
MQIDIETPVVPLDGEALAVLRRHGAVALVTSNGLEIPGLDVGQRMRIVPNTFRAASIEDVRDAVTSGVHAIVIGANRLDPTDLHDVEMYQAVRSFVGLSFRSLKSAQREMVARQNLHARWGRARSNLTLVMLQKTRASAAEVNALKLN